MKTTKSPRILVYAVIFIVTIIALLFTCETNISNTFIVVPSLILIAVVTIIFHSKSKSKLFAIIPTAFAIVYSALSIGLSYRIYDPSLSELYPFHNIISSQLSNVIFGIVLSVVLLGISFMLSRTPKSE